MYFRTEEDYWDDYYDRLDEAKREIIKEENYFADLEEFDSDAEREDYITERINQRLDELECSFK